jgi:hypothetical protein
MLLFINTQFSKNSMGQLLTWSVKQVSDMVTERLTNRRKRFVPMTLAKVTKQTIGFQTNFSMQFGTTSASNRIASTNAQQQQFMMVTVELFQKQYVLNMQQNRSGMTASVLYGNTQIATIQKAGTMK